MIRHALLKWSDVLCCTLRARWIILDCFSTNRSMKWTLSKSVKETIFNILAMSLTWQRFKLCWNTSSCVLTIFIWTKPGSHVRTAAWDAERVRVRVCVCAINTKRNRFAAVFICRVQKDDDMFPKPTDCAALNLAFVFSCILSAPKDAARARWGGGWGKGAARRGESGPRHQGLALLPVYSLYCCVGLHLHYQHRNNK